MIIDIFSLFPGMFEGPFSESIIQRAQEKGLVSLKIHNLREFATDKHQTADDYPYGGGAGMIMKPDLIFSGVESVLEENPAIANADREIILLTPQGNVFNQSWAKELAHKKNIIFISGHYKGIDERVRDYLITQELSLGDYVLTGGELPTMVVVDAVIRLIPGVLSTRESAEGDSFYENLLDAPYYTRPSKFRDYEVPEVLLSGHHENIRKWRRKEALRRTLRRRPDLLTEVNLTEEDKQFLKEIEEEEMNS